SACGIWRASASISVIACSAVVIELPNGVFITMMPRAVAAGMSTLSTPMPARPITLRFFACSRIFGDTFVAERIASPSNLPIVAASLSLSLPRLGWKSTSTPRSLKICTAALDNASEMRTLGAIDPSLRHFGRARGARAGNPSGNKTTIGWIGLDSGFALRAPRNDPFSRCFRQRGFGLGKGPVEPCGERLDVALLDGRAAPDAKARRRIAVVCDVVGDAVLFEPRGERFDEIPLPFRRQFRDRGVDHLHADRGVGSRGRVACHR